MKNFQIVSLAIFGGLALFGILAFSGAIPLGKKDKNVVRGTVTIWGTFPQSPMNSVLEDFNRANKTFTVRYKEQDAAFYGETLVEAFASGKGPDLFFLPSDMLYDYRDKVYVLPYESFPMANFRSAFASAGEIFTTKKGILALPITVDPLVLYYNRSMLDSAGIVYPPTYWDELLEMVPKLTQITEDRQIVRSTVAMGQFLNIMNAKEILSMLFFQSGNQIVTEDHRGIFSSTLGDNRELLGGAASFYTDFSNPAKTSYSWNRSLPNSRDYFTSEKSAFYFGFASEYDTLISRNPNQNLAVAPVPQIKGATSKATFAKSTGIAVSAFTKQLNTALAARSLMTNGNFTSDFLAMVRAIPARRDLLNQKPTDAFLPVFYNSALIGRTWMDPDPRGSYSVFQEIGDDILSGGRDPGSAVAAASGRLNILLVR